MKTLWRGFVPYLSILVSLSFAGKNEASAQALEGTIEKQSLQSDLDQRSRSSPGIVLEGGVKEGAALKPSIKLMPETTTSGSKLNGSAKQSLYPLKSTKSEDRSNGGAPPRTLTPVSSPAPHPIPPISSYQLTPRIGVIHTPGYAIPSVQTRTGVSAYVPGFEVTSIRFNNHVVSTARRQTTSTSTTYGGSTSTQLGFGLTASARAHGTAFGSGQRNGPVTRKGVVSYDPGYVVSLLPKQERRTQTLRYDKSTVTTRSGVASYIPGYEVSIAASTKPASRWIPERDTLIASAGQTKSTLGGNWYSPSNSEPISLNARTELLQPDYMYTQPVIAERNQGLLATAQILPGAQSAMGADWDAWFDRVGQSVYSRWQRAEVGPGSVKIRVNVDRFRNLSCEVADFRPAAFVERDSAAETAFRVTAIRAVRDLSKYEIPHLPLLPPQKHSINFEIEMSRAVDGPGGFHVVTASK